MSPEAVHGLRLTPRVDLYSLGCAIREILSGATLFDNKSPYMIQVAHVEQPPTPLCESRPDSPAVLDLRRDLTGLLGGRGNYPAALEILEPLHADLCVLRGPDDPFTEEVSGMRDELMAAVES